MSDPHTPRDVGVTLKFPESKRYANDNPWITFRGTPQSIREDILAVMGWNPADNELGLAALVLNAQREVTALATVANGMGGRVISEGSGKPAGPAWEAAAGGSSDPWAAPAADKPPSKSEAEIEVERLTAEVAATTTVADLQQLWARNQEAFKDAALMEAYKAKGKALST